MPNTPQLTNTILMVRPVDFVFNEQTAQDNEFQRQLTSGNATQLALQEFESAVERLNNEGVQVLVVEKDTDLPALPDAVFPNNWFGTDSNGIVHIFPMKTPNRKAETGQLDQVLGLLEEKGFDVREVVEWESLLGEGAVLEGTGSLILDRKNKKVYAALSERTQKEATLKFAEQLGFEAILFRTRSTNGSPYYHTNVVMSIGEKVALVCLECIPDSNERDFVKKTLSDTHTVVEISIDQLEKGFCGNLLQVLAGNGKAITVLSATAFEHLSPIQRSELENFGPLVPIAIPTIEYVGGGSIRCMMAEIFCPQSN